ncbi:glycine betaine ABC transporter substrate-binding protein [Dietzia sp.]|uniref:glycine betaine ABC transporter substrate-binding protein n=1 Tax=Dietzia sp. TaxID=1871616 RepID=UPI002FD8E90A
MSGTNTKSAMTSQPSAAPRADAGTARGRVGTWKRLGAAASAFILAATVSACGLGTAGGFTPSGTLAGPVEGIDLDGVAIPVASKNFTEQILLGKMAVELFKSAGAEVKDLTNAPGSNTSRQTMLSGDSKFSWEYTGTAWVSYLEHDDPIPDEQKQYEAVRDEDAVMNDLAWLPPAPMNNTYSFATPRATAERLGITKMSEIPSIPENEQTYCVEAEFAARNDGFQPWLARYDLPAPPPSRVSTLDTGTVYAATADGTCTFGEVFTTDGRILALDLVVLEDDRQFFPKYNLSGVVNGELLRDNPQIAELIGAVSKKLTNEVLQVLNGRIDVDGEDPADVAFEWLQSEGFLE